MSAGADRWARLRHGPREPVELPAHLRHGTSYVHRYYACRCEECQSWRRDYDQGRDRRIRDGTRRTDKTGWYVCLGKWGGTHAEHEYTRRGTCLRCNADRATEEFWERKWEQ